MSIFVFQMGRTAWRRLLQLDQPVPPRSDGEIAIEVAQNYRWNFTVNLLDGATFWFSAAFVSASTIMPLFVSKLTDSTLLIGLVAVLAQATYFLPQIFAAIYTEKSPRKKAIVVNLGFFTERLPVWLWPIAALVAPWSPTWALVLFFVGLAWHGLGAGAIGPAWQDMLARCFPVHKRGRFFGTTTFIGTGIGAFGALFSGWLLEAYPFSLNFFYIFLIGAVGINLSWGFLALTREPIQPINVEALSLSQRPMTEKLSQIVSQDHNFRRFLLARFVQGLGFMGLGFVTVAAIQRFQVPDGVVGLYTVALLIGQTVGNLVAGWLADRFGHKLSLVITGIASTLAFSLAWLAPAADWYYLIFFLMGVALGTTIVAGVLIVLEFSTPEQRPTYIGITNTSAGISGLLAPLLGGWLASFSYNWLFFLSAMFSLLGVVLLLGFVHDPRHAALPD